MNAATLTRVKAVSGTTAELIELIKINTLKTKASKQLEITIYHAEEEDALLVLTLWKSLNMISDINDRYSNSLSPKLLASSLVVRRDVFKMVKDYRVETAKPALSRMRVFNMPTTEPEEWLKEITRRPLQAVKDRKGVVGLWVGRATDEPENTLKLIVRMDWNSKEEHQKFQKSDETRVFFSNFLENGGKLEHAGINFLGAVSMPEW